MAASIGAPSDLLERVVAEIDERLRELRPAVEEQRELLGAAAALGLDDIAAVSPPRRRRTASRRRARLSAPRGAVPRGAVQQAIVAALAHGSHTLAELALVTAHPAPGLRRQLAALLDGGAVKRARREGKSAYALMRSPD